MDFMEHPYPFSTVFGPVSRIMLRRQSHRLSSSADSVALFGLNRQAQDEIASNHLCVLTSG
jgi:hypothetical protein